MWHYNRIGKKRDNWYFNHHADDFAYKVVKFSHKDS